MTLRNHLIWTMVFLIGGFIVVSLTGSGFVLYFIGLLLGIVLGFRAVISVFIKPKPRKKVLTPDEEFKQAFGEDSGQLRINDTYPEGHS